MEENVQTTAQAENTEIAKVDTQEVKPFTLKVKYNHNEMELDEEKARELAQKGLNYDKVKSELDRIKGLEDEKKLLEQSEKYFEDKGEIITDENLRLTAYKAVKDKEQAEALETQKQKLFAKYEGLKDTDITPDVIDAFLKDGTSFVSTFELNVEKAAKAKLEAELKALKEAAEIEAKNKENEMSAMGSAGGGGGIESEKEFFTKDEIKHYEQNPHLLTKSIIQKINNSLRKGV